MIKKTEGIQKPLQSTTTDWREHWYKALYRTKQTDQITKKQNKEICPPLAWIKNQPSH